MATENTTHKVTLTGPQETLLATLYGRSRDAARPNSVLHDKWAVETVEKIDYDFSKIGMNDTSCVGVSIRALVLDTWTTEFLAAHPSATVIHLACGLDSRNIRVPFGSGVRWIDLDLPDVVALRNELQLPVPDGDYTLKAGSATEPDEWLGDLPADRPAIVVLEGLTMYLEEDKGRHMFERLVSHFQAVGGQFAFDAYGTVAIRLQKRIKPVAMTGSQLSWGIDDPKLFASWFPGLKLLNEYLSVDMPGQDSLPLAGKIQLWVAAHLPYLRDAGRVLRYEFGPRDEAVTAPSTN
ncbi:tetracenomycin polyketide synthesis O-methyltransferase tcmP [Microdochium trichocladiopsis]|uniref:Tetracenomycin polyketide synthesis O-methyltransferase tcmP n=1 Tax=Microdochium trichocladiopsis TaxID=1682393 RepID=A0A9P8XZE5_9PEZI|nr:tetracenomycin polyketide synthesis O-methyltransferase tcmP [Microdochium trichocladiopsis]KAH7024870.1 tetracenomycin polyketide synthesis O-methyltransferase tcmP [Microdochium trichocladiopsis]